MTIHYLTGDATQPQGVGRKIIAHIVNDRGGWGKGFVLALSKRWKEPERFYRRWASESTFKLGEIQCIPVDRGDTFVINMVAQHGYKRDVRGVPPIRLSPLATCLGKVAVEARHLGATVHMPRIGTGLAGGKWDEIEPLIARELHRVQVFVYDLPSGSQ